MSASRARHCALGDRGSLPPGPSSRLGVGVGGGRTERCPSIRRGLQPGPRWSLRSVCKAVLVPHLLRGTHCRTALVRYLRWTSAEGVGLGPEHRKASARTNGRFGGKAVTEDLQVPDVWAMGKFGFSARGGGGGVWERGSRDRPVPRGQSKTSGDDSSPAPRSGPEDFFFNNNFPPRYIPPNEQRIVGDHFESYVLGYLRTPIPPPPQP